MDKAISQLYKSSNIESNNNNMSELQKISDYNIPDLTHKNSLNLLKILDACQIGYISYNYSGNLLNYNKVIENLTKEIEIHEEHSIINFDDLLIEKSERIHEQGSSMVPRQNTSNTVKTVNTVTLPSGFPGQGFQTLLNSKMKNNENNETKNKDNSNKEKDGSSISSINVVNNPLYINNNQSNTCIQGKSENNNNSDGSMNFS
jgi:hypothetical protein